LWFPSFFRFLANIPRLSHIYSGTAMAVIVADQRLTGITNFTGFADHDAFTADVRLRSERYGVVRQISTPSRSATRALPIPASNCRQFGEYRFA
jgi:hypothetical protein